MKIKNLKYIFILEIVSLFLSVHLFAQEKLKDSLHLLTLKKLKRLSYKGVKHK
jgi:hypothetical protein